MRRVGKPLTSKVLIENLNYKPRGNNTKIAELLCEEQYNICVYTETYLGRSDKKDIEHFNPMLKGTINDNYQNWFLVKSQWNGEKASKWIGYQPVLHPTAEEFEQRVIYFEGEYYAASLDDKEAVNLVKLLKLDDQPLANTRKRYIKRIKETILLSGKTSQKFIDDLLIADHDDVYFIRALEEELNVKVNFDLLRTT